MAGRRIPMEEVMAQAEVEAARAELAAVREEVAKREAEEAAAAGEGADAGDGAAPAFVDGLADLGEALHADHRREHTAAAPHDGQGGGGGSAREHTDIHGTKIRGGIPECTFVPRGATSKTALRTCICCLLAAG